MPTGPVPADTEALLDALRPWLAAPERAAVLLDIDGTLAPIVRHADDAHVPEPTRVPLIAIARRYGLVACVSGRRASDARRMVSLGTITYIGNHGAETLPGGATSATVDPEVQQWAETVRAFARTAFTDEVRRLRVREEDKATIAAFHWRGAPDEPAAELAVRAIADRAEHEGLVTHWGRKVLEVRPPVGATKGTGIRSLIEATDVEVALFAGDDRTDVDAFETLRALVDEGTLRAALCIGVRSDETPDEVIAAADLLVDGTGGVRAMLEVLAAA